MLRELGEQIKHLLVNVLNAQSKGPEVHPVQSQHHDHAAAHDRGAHHEHHASLLLSVWMIRFIAESLSAIGVAVMVLAAVGLIPLILTDVIPFFFRPRQNRPDAQGSMLLCRMQLARGIMLGMDFMVAADVVETLLHQIDLVKLLCIIAIRSWLGFERAKEAQHISHEISNWEKAHPLLAKNLGDITDQDGGLGDRIRETFNQYDTNHDGTVSKAELRQAFTRVGLDVNEKEMAAILGDKESLTFDHFNQYVRKLAQETLKNAKAKSH
jgi:uncharacterized membrane protein